MQPVTPTIDPGFMLRLQLAEPADDALLGVIANRAGVDENDVRTVGPIDGVIAVRRELSEHQLGIAHVHLAAVGLDVDGGTRFGHASKRTARQAVGDASRQHHRASRAANRVRAGTTDRPGEPVR